MANNNLKSRIVICNDTTANWGSSEKVLLKGEMGIEIMESGAPKIKIGDGVNKFADLPYVAMTPAEVATAISNAIDTNVHVFENQEILDAITAAYTTEEQEKLAGIATGAQVNVLEGVKVNGTALTATDKVVDVTVPTQASDIDAIDVDQLGVAGGVATLDENGLVPASQLPSYVDDVIEVANKAALPATGETSKIYVTLDTNLTYRWGGSEYVEISESLALGETEATAYAGSKGKALKDAFDAHEANVSNPHAVTAAQVGLGNLTNDKQVKAVADADATEGNVVLFGADGATVKDSGLTIKTSVPEGAVFTDTTYEVFTGAGEEAGAAGLVPAPATTEKTYFLKGDGTWAVPTNTDTMVTTTPDATKKIYLTGTESASETTGTLLVDTAVYVDAEAGKLVATKFVGAVEGNASTATTLETARTFSITGGATAAAVSFDGSDNVALEVTAVDAAKLTIADSDTLILDGGSAN